MNTEQTLTTTARSLKMIAILSACAAFILIGGVAYIKYAAWHNKGQITSTRAIDAATKKVIEQETNVEKVRASALQYHQAYTDRCDQADFTINEIGNIALAASLFPILILLRVMNDLKRLRSPTRFE